MERDLLAEYQSFVSLTESPAVKDMTHKERLMYFALGMCGEAGEAGEKIKKLVRDHDGQVPDHAYFLSIAKELGDIQWYIAELCQEVTRACFSSALLDMKMLFEVNMEKLQDRLDRNKIQGSGDNR